MNDESIDRRLKALNIIHSRKVSGEVEVFLGTENKWKCLDPNTDIEEHSNYLALYIVKRDSGDMIKLRLKTMRKVFKWLMGLNFVPHPRKLNFLEKLFK